MQIRVRAHRIDVSEEARLAIERKFRIALGRYRPGIDRAQITLSAGRGQHSGCLCRVLLNLRQGPGLEVEQHAEDARAAAAAAAWRLEQRLERRRAIESMGASARRFATR